MTNARLRLRKVMVEPHFDVIVEGQPDPVPLPPQTVEVVAEDWPTFHERFKRDVADAEKAIQAEYGGNREQRRKRAKAKARKPARKPATKG